jgi:tetratricopeptide (TPR) repeat protein
MNLRLFLAIGIAIAALSAPVAVAQSPDALAKAQAAFDQAQSNYLQGKYDEAAAGFQDAYASRPFPQFLYNIAASFHMKGKKTSDVEAYKKAVEFYRQYLKEEPGASDKAKVERAIGVLEAEIKRLQDLAAQAAAQNQGSAAGSGSAAVAAPVTASQEVQQLGDVKVRGLVVIVTEPQNATIYLDDKKKGKFAETPWSGSIEGEHKLIIEKRGYKPVETVISADPTKLVQVVSVMSQEDYLAWIEVTSNVPGADIFIDDKSIGAVGKTPLVPGQNIKPGTHTFWITAEGYDEYKETIDIAPGETKAIKATLKGSPIGKLTVSGLGIEDSQILMDGAELCPTGPCLKSVPEGSHVIEVRRDGYKPYKRRIQIVAKTETTIKVQQAPSPGRGDAIVAYVFAGIFGGAAAYLGTQANKLQDELKADIAAGNPPVDNNDPRFFKGKVYAISADACFAIGGIALLSAIYYTFRDKGPPTRAQIDVRTLALTPHVGSQYAGIGLEGRF